jgi:adenylate cyclase
MLAALPSPNDAAGSPSGGFRSSARRVAGWAWTVAMRFPFVTLFLIVFLSNVLGSLFNFFYNTQLIVDCCMDDQQKAVFWEIASPLYNVVAYPAGVGLTIWLIWPLMRCRKLLRAGRSVSPSQLELCRRRLVNLPFYQVCINFVGWLPGVVVFPLLVCWVGGSYNAFLIWGQFILSFAVTALLTTAGTYFLMEWFLIQGFYPDFFQNARPAQVHGVIRISFARRLGLLGLAVVAPLLALWLVAIDVSGAREAKANELRFLANVVMFGGALSAGLVFWLVGRELASWVAAHATAMGEVEKGNLNIHIHQPRADELGVLTDGFNDMIAARNRAEQMRETFGEFVGGPDVRDDILHNYPGFCGEVQTITVLFVDIRGFTRRTAGENPERVVELLNRFLTLAANAIQSNGGLVNKFLGDGVMALFGVRQRRANHACQAITAARELVAKLAAFNEELVHQGEAPLKIGIGIHTGPALVGCIGATVTLADGRESMRREFTAIGQTVNLAQRLEQLTKCREGPILLSEQTRLQLDQPPKLQSFGIQGLPGYDGTLVVYRVDEA